VDSCAEGTRSVVYGISLTLFREKGCFFIFIFHPHPSSSTASALQKSSKANANTVKHGMDDELNEIANQFAELNIEEQALLRRREDLTLRLQQARQGEQEQQ